MMSNVRYQALCALPRRCPSSARALARSATCQILDSKYIVAGLGAIAFFAAIDWATQLFLGHLAGYTNQDPEDDPLSRRGRGVKAYQSLRPRLDHGCFHW